ncbi:LysE family translocator [Pontibacillus yanchengensis]|nr:LysE family transporter [Pontibacillus yanchengensis]
MITLVVGYIVLGLSIAAPVGPINIEIIKRGLLYGFWPSFCVGLGGMSSDLLLMVGMFFGLAQLLSIIWVKISLMMLGCFILIHSGIMNMGSVTSVHESNERVTTIKKNLPIKSYLTGATIAGTNPMNLLFWLGIYGSVLSTALQEGNTIHSFLLSSLVFIGIGLWNLNLSFTIHLRTKIDDSFCNENSKWYRKYFINWIWCEVWCRCRFRISKDHEGNFYCSIIKYGCIQFRPFSILVQMLYNRKRLGGEPVRAFL